MGMALLLLSSIIQVEKQKFNHPNSYHQIYFAALNVPVTILLREFFMMITKQIA